MNGERIDQFKQMGDQVGVVKSFVEEHKSDDDSRDLPLLLFHLVKDEETGITRLVPVVHRRGLMSRSDALELATEIEEYANYFDDEWIEMQNKEMHVQSVMNAGGWDREQAVKHIETQNCLYQPQEDTRVKVSGFIYLVSAKGANRYKIGLTTNIERRFKRLEQQAPFPLVLIHFFATSDCLTSESALHQRFASSRVHGEWFELTDEDVKEICAIEGRS